MRIDILTLFPAAFAGPFSESIVGRACRRGLVEVNLVDLRDFATDRRGDVDDVPFGGGAGMLLKAEVLFAAIEGLRQAESTVVLLTPQGERFAQAAAERMAGLAHLIMVCGHYEGVDERVRQTLIDYEVSIGDYVLTNGNLAAMVVCDAVVRLVPGVLGSDDSAGADSFARDRRLEYPQYTRPAEFRGMRVPSELLSGNHGKIEQWRSRQARVRTVARRPDLLSFRSGNTTDNSSSE